MLFIIFTIAAAMSFFMISRYFKCSKAQQYAYSVGLTWFVVNGYQLFITKEMDPFILISSLIAIPCILIIIMLTDFFYYKEDKRKKKSEIITSSISALFLTAVPLAGYIIFGTSTSYINSANKPDWNNDEERMIELARKAVNANPNRPSQMGLASKSIAYIENGSQYRVIFSYKGRELAVVRLQRDSENIVELYIHENVK